MPGEILHEATGERLTSKEALRLWNPDRLAGDPRVRAVLSRYAERTRLSLRPTGARRRAGGAD